MSLTTVNDYKHPDGWLDVSDELEHARRHCRQLEQGEILFFADIPFDLPEEDQEFLLSQRRGDSRIHKNVSYGLPIADRSAYDRFMLRFHDYLKENAEFQGAGDKIRLEFPPRATWIVFTDAVPHAALSGQFALEQTFIVPTAALLTPETAPIKVLESLSGRTLSV